MALSALQNAVMTPTEKRTKHQQRLVARYMARRDKHNEFLERQDRERERQDRLERQRLAQQQQRMAREATARLVRAIRSA